MNVLITGGTGLIGRALCKALIKRGDRAVVLSRNPELAKGMPAGVELRRWDGRTASGWEDLVNQVDAIVNLAGENIASGRWTAERKQRIRKSRLDVGKSVVDAIAMADRKPRVLIQASATGFYGPHGSEIVTERTPAGDDFLAHLAAEWEESTAPLEAIGVRRAIIRTGIVLSTKGGALPRMMFPFRFFAGGTLGSGKQWMPWIHMADEIGAILFLLDDEGASGPFNLSAPEPVTNEEFTKALGRAMGRPAFMRIPAFALKLLLGEMATVVLDGQRAIPERLLDAGYRFEFASLAPALQDLIGGK